MLKSRNMETFRINGKAFERLGKIVPQYYKKKLLSEFGTIAVNFSKERFIKKNWKDQVSEPWKPRKRKDRGSLLAKTGRLKRSIRKRASGADYVIIGSDVPYAKIHNEGGRTQKSVYVSSHTRKKTIPKSVNLRTRKASRQRIATGESIKVKSHIRKMNISVPQRQFMGKSRALELRLQLHLKKSLTEQIKKNIK